MKWKRSCNDAQQDSCFALGWISDNFQDLFQSSLDLCFSFEFLQFLASFFYVSSVMFMVFMVGDPVGSTVVTCSNYNCSCYILLLLLLVLKGAAKKRSKAPKIQTPQMEMAELPFTWLQVMEVCHAYNCCPTSRARVLWILGYFNIF